MNFHNLNDYQSYLYCMEGHYLFYVVNVENFRKIFGDLFIPAQQHWNTQAEGPKPTLWSGWRECRMEGGCSHNLK